MRSSHLGFWSGNLFLIAPFPDLCLLVPFHSVYTLLLQKIKLFSLYFQCGDTFIQLYTELCKYAINIDKGNMEKELNENENLQAVKERQFAIAKTCVRMAYMLREYDFRIAKICGLTAFALDTTFDSLNLVNRLYWTVKFTAATSSGSKVDPATLYEIERLLEPLRPNVLDPEFTWKKIIPLCKKYKTERDVLLKESCQYVPVLKDPKQSLKYFKKGSSTISASSVNQGPSASGTDSRKVPEQEIKKPTAVDIDRLLGQQFPRGVGKSMQDYSMKDLDKTIDDLKKSINEETQYRKILHEAGFTGKEKKQKGPTIPKDPNVKKERVKKEPKQDQQRSISKTIIPQTHPQSSKGRPSIAEQTHQQQYQGSDKMAPPAAHRSTPGPFSPPVVHQGSPGFRSPPVAHASHHPSSPRDLISPKPSGSNQYPSQVYRQNSVPAQFSPNTYSTGSVNQKTPFSSSASSSLSSSSYRPPSVSQTASDMLKQSLSTKIHSEMLRNRQHLSGSVSQLNTGSSSLPGSNLQRQHSVPNLPSTVTNENLKRSYTIEYATNASSSPAECARIAQQIAQMHLKQRAEREKLEGKKPRKPRQKKVQDVPKTSLTSKSVPNKSQLSEMLGQTVKTGAETNSERVQNIVHIRNQILQAENANRLTSDSRQMNPSFQQMGNAANLNLSNNANLTQQTVRNDPNINSGQSQQADPRAQNPKFYLTSNSAINKLKKDETGGLNLTDSTGLAVKPVFSMIVPRSLTTPDNQEELVRRVTNMVKKATSAQESPGTYLAPPRSNTALQRASSPQVQSNVRPTSSANQSQQKTAEDIKSTPVPDHVLEFLKTKSKGEQRPQKPEPNRMLVRSVSLTTQDQNRSINSLQSSTASARPATVTSRQQIQSPGLVPTNTNMEVSANASSQLTAMSGVALPQSQSSLNILANVATNSAALPGQQQNNIPTNYGNQNQAPTGSDGSTNIAMITKQPTQNLQRPNIPQQNIVPQTTLQQKMKYTTQTSTEARIRLPVVTSEQSEQRFMHVFDQFGNKQIVNMTPQTHLMPSNAQTDLSQLTIGGAQSNLAQQSQSSSTLSLHQIAPSTGSISNFIPLQPSIPTVAFDSTGTIASRLQPEGFNVVNTGVPATPQMSSTTETATATAPRQQFNIVPELSPAVVQQILTDLMKTGSQQDHTSQGQGQKVSAISPQTQNPPQQQHKRDIYIFPKSLADGAMQIMKDSGTGSIAKTVLDHTKQVLSGSTLNQAVQNTTSGQFYSPNYMNSSSDTLSTSQIPNRTSSFVRQNTVPMSHSQTNMPNQLLQVPDLPDLNQFGIDEILRTDNVTDQNNQRPEITEKQPQKYVNKTNELNANQMSAVSGKMTDKMIPKQLPSSSQTASSQDVIKINSDQDMLKHVESLLSGKKNITLAKETGQVVKQASADAEKNLGPGPVHRQDNTMDKKLSTTNPLLNAALSQHEEVENKVTQGKSTFFNAARLAKEREEREMKMKQEKANTKSNDDKLSVKICGICSQTFNTLEKLREHVQFNLCPSKQCKVCESMFSSLEELRNHLKTPCKGTKGKQLKDFEYTKIFVCSKCNFTSQNEKIGTKHIENCHVGSPVKAKVTIWFKCHMCREVLHDKDLAYKHISRFCPQLKAAKAQQDAQNAMDKLKGKADKLVCPVKPEPPYKDPKSFIQDCFVPENSQIKDVKQEMSVIPRQTTKTDKILESNKTVDAKSLNIEKLVPENVKVGGTEIKMEKEAVTPHLKKLEQNSLKADLKVSTKDNDRSKTNINKTDITISSEKESSIKGKGEAVTNTKVDSKSVRNESEEADVKITETQGKNNENVKKLTNSILGEIKKAMSDVLKKDKENQYKTEKERTEVEESTLSEKKTSQSVEKRRTRTPRKEKTEETGKSGKKQSLSRKQLLSPKIQTPESDLNESQSCKLCLYSTSNQRSLARHYTQAHDFGFKLQSKRYRCKYCDVSFQSSSKVKIKGHVMKHSEILLNQIAKCKHLNRNYPHLTPEKSTKNDRNTVFSPRRMKKHLKARAARSKCAENLKRLSYGQKKGVEDESDSESEERSRGRPRKYPVGQEPYIVNKKLYQQQQKDTKHNNKEKTTKSVYENNSRVNRTLQKDQSKISTRSHPGKDIIKTGSVKEEQKFKVKHNDRRKKEEIAKGNVNSDDEISESDVEAGSPIRTRLRKRKLSQADMNDTSTDVASNSTCKIRSDAGKEARDKSDASTRNIENLKKNEETSNNDIARNKRKKSESDDTKDNLENNDSHKDKEHRRSLRPRRSKIIKETSESESESSEEESASDIRKSLRSRGHNVNKGEIEQLDSDADYEPSDEDVDVVPLSKRLRSGTVQVTTSDFVQRDQNKEGQTDRKRNLRGEESHSEESDDDFTDDRPRKTGGSERRSPRRSVRASNKFRTAQDSRLQIHTESSSMSEGEGRATPVKERLRERRSLNTSSKEIPNKNVKDHKISKTSKLTDKVEPCRDRNLRPRRQTRQNGSFEGDVQASIDVIFDAVEEEYDTLKTNELQADDESDKDSLIEIVSESSEEESTSKSRKQNKVKKGPVRSKARKGKAKEEELSEDDKSEVLPETNVSEESKSLSVLLDPDEEFGSHVEVTVSEKQSKNKEVKTQNASVKDKVIKPGQASESIDDDEFAFVRTNNENTIENKKDVNEFSKDKLKAVIIEDDEFSFVSTTSTTSAKAKSENNAKPADNFGSEFLKFTQKQLSVKSNSNESDESGEEINDSNVQEHNLKKSKPDMPECESEKSAKAIAGPMQEKLKSLRDVSEVEAHESHQGQSKAEVTTSRRNEGESNFAAAFQAFAGVSKLAELASKELTVPAAERQKVKESMPEAKMTTLKVSVEQSMEKPPKDNITSPVTSPVIGIKKPGFEDAFQEFFQKKLRLGSKELKNMATTSAGKPKQINVLKGKSLEESLPPCNVLINRLTEKEIDKYTSPKQTKLLSAVSDSVELKESIVESPKPESVEPGKEISKEVEEIIILDSDDESQEETSEIVLIDSDDVLSSAEVEDLNEKSLDKLDTDEIENIAGYSVKLVSPENSQLSETVADDVSKGHVTDKTREQQDVSIIEEESEQTVDSEIDATKSNVDTLRTDEQQDVCIIEEESTQTADSEIDTNNSNVVTLRTDEQQDVSIIEEESAQTADSEIDATKSNVDTLRTDEQQDIRIIEEESEQTVESEIDTTDSNVDTLRTDEQQDVCIIEEESAQTVDSEIDTNNSNVDTLRTDEQQDVSIIEEESEETVKSETDTTKSNVDTLRTDEQQNVSIIEEESAQIVESKIDTTKSNFDTLRTDGNSQGNDAAPLQDRKEAVNELITSTEDELVQETKGSNVDTLRTDEQQDVCNIEEESAQTVESETDTNNSNVDTLRIDEQQDVSIIDTVESETDATKSIVDIVRTDGNSQGDDAEPLQDRKKVVDELITNDEIVQETKGSSKEAIYVEEEVPQKLMNKELINEDTSTNEPENLESKITDQEIELVQTSESAAVDIITETMKDKDLDSLNEDPSKEDNQSLQTMETEEEQSKLKLQSQSIQEKPQEENTKLVQDEESKITINSDILSAAKETAYSGGKTCIDMKETSEETVNSSEETVSSEESEALEVVESSKSFTADYNTQIGEENVLGSMTKLLHKEGSSLEIPETESISDNIDTSESERTDQVDNTEPVHSVISDAEVTNVSDNKVEKLVTEKEGLSKETETIEESDHGVDSEHEKEDIQAHEPDLSEMFDPTEIDDLELIEIGQKKNSVNIETAKETLTFESESTRELDDILEVKDKTQNREKNDVVITENDFHISETEVFATIDDDENNMINDDTICLSESRKEDIDLNYHKGIEVGSDIHAEDFCEEQQTHTEFDASRVINIEELPIDTQIGQTSDTEITQSGNMTVEKTFTELKSNDAENILDTTESEIVIAHIPTENISNEKNVLERKETLNPEENPCEEDGIKIAKGEGKYLKAIQNKVCIDAQSFHERLSNKQQEVDNNTCMEEMSAVDHSDLLEVTQDSTEQESLSILCEEKNDTSTDIIIEFAVHQEFVEVDNKCGNQQQESQDSLNLSPESKITIQPEVTLTVDDSQMPEFEASKLDSCRAKDNTALASDNTFQSGIAVSTKDDLPLNDSNSQILENEDNTESKASSTSPLKDKLVPYSDDESDEEFSKMVESAGNEKDQQEGITESKLCEDEAQIEVFDSGENNCDTKSVEFNNEMSESKNYLEYETPHRPCQSVESIDHDENLVTCKLNDENLETMSVELNIECHDQMDKSAAVELPYGEAENSEEKESKSISGALETSSEIENGLSQEEQMAFAYLRSVWKETEIDAVTKETTEESGDSDDKNENPTTPAKEMQTVQTLTLEEEGNKSHMTEEVTDFQESGGSNSSCITPDMLVNKQDVECDFQGFQGKTEENYNTDKEDSAQSLFETHNAFKVPVKTSDTVNGPDTETKEFEDTATISGSEIKMLQPTFQTEFSIPSTESALKGSDTDQESAKLQEETNTDTTYSLASANECEITDTTAREIDSSTPQPPLATVGNTKQEILESVDESMNMQTENTSESVDESMNMQTEITSENNLNQIPNRCILSDVQLEKENDLTEDQQKLSGSLETLDGSEDKADAEEELPNEVKVSYPDSVDGDDKETDNIPEAHSEMELTPTVQGLQEMEADPEDKFETKEENNSELTESGLQLQTLQESDFHPTDHNVSFYDDSIVNSEIHVEVNSVKISAETEFLQSAEFVAEKLDVQDDRLALAATATLVENNQLPVINKPEIIIPCNIQQKEDMLESMTLMKEPNDNIKDTNRDELYVSRISEQTPEIVDSVVSQDKLHEVENVSENTTDFTDSEADIQKRQPLKEESVDITEHSTIIADTNIREATIENECDADTLNFQNKPITQEVENLDTETFVRDNGDSSFGNIPEDRVTLDSHAVSAEYASIVKEYPETTELTEEKGVEQGLRESDTQNESEINMQADYGILDEQGDITQKVEANLEARTESNDLCIIQENAQTTCTDSLIVEFDSLQENINMDVDQKELSSVITKDRTIPIEHDISAGASLKDVASSNSVTNITDPTADMGDDKSLTEKCLDSTELKTDAADVKQQDQSVNFKEDEMKVKICHEEEGDVTIENTQEVKTALLCNITKAVKPDISVVSVEKTLQTKTDLQNLPEMYVDREVKCDDVSEFAAVSELTETTSSCMPEEPDKKDVYSERVVDSIQGERELAVTSDLSTNTELLEEAVCSNVVGKSISLVTETKSTEKDQSMMSDLIETESTEKDQTTKSKLVEETLSNVAHIPAARFYKSPPREIAVEKVLDTYSKVSLPERQKIETGERSIKQKPIVKNAKENTAVKQSVITIQSKTIMKKECPGSKVVHKKAVGQEMKTQTAQVVGKLSVPTNTSSVTANSNIMSKETGAKQATVSTKKTSIETGVKQSLVTSKKPKTRRQSVKEITVPVEEGDKEDLEEFNKRTESVKKSFKRSKGKGYQFDFNLEDDDHDDGMSTCSSSSSGTSFSSHGLDLESLKVVPGPSHAVPEPPRTASPTAECISPQKNTVSTMTAKIADRKTYDAKQCLVSKAMSDNMKKYSKRPIKRLMVINSEGLTNIPPNAGTVSDKTLLLPEGSDLVRKVSLPNVGKVIKQYSKFSLPLREEPDSPKSVSSESNSGSDSGANDTAGEATNPLKSFRKMHPEDAPFSWGMDEEKSCTGKGKSKRTDTKVVKSVVATAEKGVGQTSGIVDQSVRYSTRRRSSVDSGAILPETVDTKTTGRRVLRSPSASKEPQSLVIKTSEVQKELPNVKKVDESKVQTNIETKVADVSKGHRHDTRGAAKPSNVCSAVKIASAPSNISDKTVIDKTNKAKQPISSKDTGVVQKMPIYEIPNVQHNTRKSMDSVKPSGASKVELEKDSSLSRTRSLSVRQLITQTVVMSEMLATDVDGTIIPDTAGVTSADLSESVRLESQNEQSLPPRGVKRKSGHLETGTSHEGKGHDELDKQSNLETPVEMCHTVDDGRKLTSKQPKLSEECKSGSETISSVKKTELNAKVIVLESNRAGKCTCQSSNSSCEECRKRQKEQKPSSSKIMYTSYKPAIRHIVHDGKVIQIKKGSITETAIGSTGAGIRCQSPKSRDMSPSPSERRSRPGSVPKSRDISPAPSERRNRLGSVTDSPKKKKSRTSGAKNEDPVEMKETSLYVKTEADLNKYIHEALKEIRKDRQHRPQEHHQQQTKQGGEKEESKWKVTKTKDSFSFKRSRPVT